MRSYLAVTGIVFALLVAVHVARTAIEGLHVLRDPFFAFSTLLSLVLCGWALKLWLRDRPGRAAG
jgi:hypothetical protein